MNETSFSRRDFIRISSIGALATLPIVSLSNKLFLPNESESDKLNIFIFSKHLQFLNYTEMSSAAKEMGFDGIDLTVRPKGHVLPEKVNEDLTIATEAMKSFDLLPLMISTSVKDANDKIDRNVLEKASELGFKYYRTAWFKYKKEQDIISALNAYKKKIHNLSKLNKQLGISGSYHNHSGHYMGASIWDLDQVLEGLSPNDMGSQYDIMHAGIEGGKNWEIGFRLIKDHINTLVVKDYKWEKVNGKWKAINVPCGTGMVDFKKYFSMLKTYNINVPMSLHVEYDLGGAEKGGKPSIDKVEVFKRIKKDLDFLKNTWQNS